MRQHIITVDFDGTIVEHRHPFIGLPCPYAFHWLKRFQELGAKLILLTMRSGDSLKEAVEFCRQNGVEFAHVNDNPSQNKWTTSRKIYSTIHIDDTNACCPLEESIQTDRPRVDWDEVGPWVEARLLGK